MRDIFHTIFAARQPSAYRQVPSAYFGHYLYKARLMSPAIRSKTALIIL